MRADARCGADTTEWHRRAISRRRGEAHQTSSVGETELAQSADVFESSGEGNEAQKRSNAVVEETCTRY